MNIRQAILRAADHVQRSPRDFEFREIAVPTACGSPGCAIGWVAHFTGMTFPVHGCGIYPHHAKTISLVHPVCESVFGVDHHEFYTRMDALSSGWRRDPVTCARALRLYADKYHPSEKGTEDLCTGIPASVRAIFDMTPEQIGAELARV
jgi:hypothetical protein